MYRQQILVIYKNEFEAQKKYIQTISCRGYQSK